MAAASNRARSPFRRESYQITSIPETEALEAEATTRTSGGSLLEMPEEDGHAPAAAPATSSLDNTLTNSAGFRQDASGLVKPAVQGAIPESASTLSLKQALRRMSLVPPRLVVPDEKQQTTGSADSSANNILGAKKNDPARRSSRRISMAHPGIPTLGFAGAAMMSAATTGRRASVLVKNGVVVMESLDDAKRSSRTDKIRRRSSQSQADVQAAGGRRMSAFRAPGMTVADPSGAISEPDIGVSIESFESAAEFPEGYLLGFSNCDEVQTPKELNIDGKIPDWLSGVFYRCGPGKFQVETELQQEDSGAHKVVEIDHWFDGFSLMHRFEVEQGKVYYRNRFTSETQEKTMKETGTLPLSFAQSQGPTDTFFKKFFQATLDVPKEFNVNVSVTPRFPLFLGTDVPPGQPTTRPILLAKTDANILQELDETTLESRGYMTYTDINPAFRGIMSSAHEQYDPITGEYFQFLQEPGPVIRTHVFSLSKDHPEGGEILATIPSRHASYIHAFGLTPNYIILICCPYYWAYGGIGIVFTKQVASALEWHGNTPTYFHVVDRHLKKHVATYESDPFFFFHTINAFEEPVKTADGSSDVNLTVDLCAYRTPSAIQEMYMEKFRSGTTNFENTYVRRYTLARVRTCAAAGTATGTASTLLGSLRNWLWARRDSSAPAEVAIDASVSSTATAGTCPRATFEIRSGPGPELPVISPFAAMCPQYQYAYSVVGTARMPFDSLAKTNVQTSAMTEWRAYGCYPCEPVFVPSPAAAAQSAGGGFVAAIEDDGVVLSVVLDGFRSTSFVLVLDAKTFTERARASLDPGAVVPFGFHGAFLDWHEHEKPKVEGEEKPKEEETAGKESKPVLRKGSSK
ncbi:hypothetical protein AMAG_01073 [Allomyces macrogynus ATCC 38327]|uniref:Uncharacterized protein n=1 Tax=Allomyces macrogynus (strain ATCC 38327) TaxID=578462 RepID=A0A0L0RYC1_ALLM3|nr:hypothetical protein AMAG_01073 [Allomyces macrogynus ATCC 38327]|eukprot:KNE55150.1 hypothetical protein AMAG_01073 [Allomyces macrogynus ATCC 38327]